MLETAVYLPGDLIIQVDDLGKEMFIVRRGVVEILIAHRPENAPRILLKDGAFFGETALVVEVRRTTSVQSVTVTDLNVLNKQVRRLLCIRPLDDTLTLGVRRDHCGISRFFPENETDCDPTPDGQYGISDVGHDQI